MDRRFVKDILGGPGRNRTTDTRIFNPLLYRLSYQAKAANYSRKTFHLTRVSCVQMQQMAKTWCFGILV